METPEQRKQNFHKELKALLKKYEAEITIEDFGPGWSEENNPQTEKEKLVNFHIEVMKQGLIEEGDEKWMDAYHSKIRETAEKYYDKLNSL